LEGDCAAAMSSPAIARRRNSDALMPLHMSTLPQVHTGPLGSLNGAGGRMDRLHPACQADPACIAFSAIEAAGLPEKDFVSWPHACETWEVGMELRHLRYFIAVADAGSLTVAPSKSCTLRSHL
jgi:DNA-binding transcriptional LysR family regulator